MTPYIYQDNLQSDRLITRKLTLDDVEDWSDFFRDKEAAEFLPNPGDMTVEERAKFWVDKQLKRYADKKFGLQALIDKKTGQFMGQCGLLMQTIDEQTEIEVGYHIFKKYWGQGYAPEAARLFIEYAFKNEISDSITSIINIHNARSQRVAEKNRLTKEKQTTWSGLDVFIYRIKRN